MDVCCKCSVRKYVISACFKLKSFGHNVEQVKSLCRSQRQRCEKHRSCSNVIWRYSMRGKVLRCISSNKSDIFCIERRRWTVLANGKCSSSLVTYSFKSFGNQRHVSSKTKKISHKSLLGNVWRSILHKEKGLFFLYTNGTLIFPLITFMETKFFLKLFIEPLKYFINLRKKSIWLNIRIR
jgi:hypothetical protein